MRRAVSIGYRQTRSSSGGCSIAVVWVAVRAPKCGNVDDQPSATAGTIVSEMQREGVAGFGALDVERAGDRVQERELAHLRRQILDRVDPAAEAVLRPGLSTSPGRQVQDRVLATEGVGELVRLGVERYGWSCPLPG